MYITDGENEKGINHTVVGIQPQCTYINDRILSYILEVCAGAKVATVKVLVTHGAGEADRAVAVTVGPEEGAAVLRVVEPVSAPVDDRLGPQEGASFVPGGASTVGVSTRAIREADDTADQGRGRGACPETTAWATLVERRWGGG